MKTPAALISLFLLATLFAARPAMAQGSPTSPDYWTQERIAQSAGKMFLLGKKAIVNRALAETLFEAAYRQDNRWARAFAYTYHRTGEAMKVIQWFERAIADGDRSSEVGLSVYRVIGRQAVQDIPKAIEILLANGSPAAHMALGEMTSAGKIPIVDGNSAEQWFVKSVQDRSAGRMSAIADDYRELRDGGREAKINSTAWLLTAVHFEDCDIAQHYCKYFHQSYQEYMNHQITAADQMRARSKSRELIKMILSQPLKNSNEGSGHSRKDDGSRFNKMLFLHKQ